MRRHDREKDEDFALNVIDNSPYGTLAMIDLNGNPYCIPLSTARIGKKIYFHCAKEGEKIDILSKNSKVCVSFVTNVNPFVETEKASYSTEYASAVVKGTAKQVTDDAEKTEGLRAICMHYTPNEMQVFDMAIARSLPRTDVWSIDIEEITGKERIRKPKQ